MPKRRKGRQKNKTTVENHNYPEDFLGTFQYPSREDFPHLFAYGRGEEEKGGYPFRINLKGETNENDYDL